jgi:hypothetical protein
LVGLIDLIVSFMTFVQENGLGTWLIAAHSSS